MAFPYVFESNLEGGVATEWGGGETDNGARAAVTHYKSLAKRGLTPYRGAYAWAVDLNGTDDATLSDTATLVQADTTTAYYAFDFFIQNGATLADTERIELLELRSAGADEAVVSLYYTTADGFIVGAVKTSATALANKTGACTTGVWHHAEVKLNLQSGGTGTIDFYLDGNACGTQTANITSAAVTGGYWGVLNQGAVGTGWIVLDRFIADDARIYPDNDRFSQSVVLTKSQHVFVGYGCIDAAALVSETDDNQILLYDTDTAQSGAGLDWKAMLNFEAITSVSGPLEFHRGCYAVLSGTNPQGIVHLMSSNSVRPGMSGPLYYSNWGYKQLGNQ